MALQTTHPQDQHTFLLQEGVWEAEGRGYISSSATEARITGRTDIRHPEPDHITLESSMRVQTFPVFDVWQRYDFKPGGRANTWSFVSKNDRVGELNGEVLFWGEYAIVHYASPKGRFRGSELMTRVNEDEYTTTGKFIADGRAEMVWSVRLRRIGS
ncbi:MAG: hypothetical protein ACREOU_13105 [Candidatus Eiseniibacteriota bacterium]